MSFHITAILARIETAHLAKFREDLGNLADEVRSCSDAILSRAGQVLEAAAALDASIASALGEASRLEAIQRRELPALLAAVDTDLAMFRARQQAAVEASAKLAIDLDSVSRDLGSIATSLQFHDITRQQVEHVIEALAELVHGRPRGGLSPPAAAVVRLQNAQLKNASAAFGQSTQRIDHDLEGVAARVGEMASASQDILGLSHNGKDCFITDMEQRFAVVLQTVGESCSSEQATRTIIAGLDGLSQRLRASVTEVQSIDLQLSRIAINAAISASHVGAPGEPLNVVAGAVQALQIECAARSRDAEADLDLIESTLLGLATGDARNASQASSETLTDELKIRVGNLRSASVSSSDAGQSVAILADTLCKNLEEARQHSGIGRRFTETVDRCCSSLDGVAAQVQPSLSFRRALVEEVSEERYTMHVEREVHQAMAAGAAELPFEMASQAASDEVEFF